MGAMITEGDIAYIQSLYPMLQIKPLTSQQEQLILLYMRGQSIKDAAKGAGYRSSATASSFLKSDTAKAVMKHLREEQFEDVRVTIDTLTSMFLEAYHRAATAGEMVAATRELGKLHGIYPDAKKPAGLEITINNVESTKQLERLPDAKLIEMAGEKVNGLLGDLSGAVDAEVVDD